MWQIVAIVFSLAIGFILGYTTAVIERTKPEEKDREKEPYSFNNDVEDI